MTFVTGTALQKRINRKLKPDGQALRKISENSHLWNEYGPYAVFDYSRNFYTGDREVDIEKFARDLGCMRDFEQLRAPHATKGG